MREKCYTGMKGLRTNDGGEGPLLRAENRPRMLKLIFVCKS